VFVVQLHRIFQLVLPLLLDLHAERGRTAVRRRLGRRGWGTLGRRFRRLRGRRRRGCLVAARSRKPCLWSILWISKQIRDYKLINTTVCMVVSNISPLQTNKFWPMLSKKCIFCT
jgi:hypothetical protein